MVAVLYRAASSNELKILVDSNQQFTVYVYPDVQNTVLAGRETVLTCQASGASNLNVRWSRPDGVLPFGVNDRDGRLTIYNTQSEHGGDYICTVTDGRLIKEIRAHLTVDTCRLIRNCFYVKNSFACNVALPRYG